MNQIAQTSAEWIEEDVDFFRTSVLQSSHFHIPFGCFNYAEPLTNLTVDGDMNLKIDYIKN